MIISTKDLTTERIRRREQRIRELEQEREMREAAVFERVPRLAQIKEIQSEIGLDLARLVLKKVPTHFGKSFEELRDWSLTLSAERSRLLEQHAIDPTVLEVQWDCAECKNTGWLPPEEAGSNRVLAPLKCRCLIQDEINDLYRAAGLTGQLREQTFEHFDLTVYPQSARKLMQGIADYCREFARAVARGDQREGLLLTGDVGLGKTLLSLSIAHMAIDARRTVVYLTFSEFLDLIRLHKFGDEDQYTEGVRRLLDADLIILDDLGAEKLTEFAGQELFNIINHRINQHMPMVVSTNLSGEEIAGYYGSRIASRILYGFEVLRLEGDDVREVLMLRRGRKRA